MEEIIISTIQRTMVAGTPLLLATTGEVLCERSGILNLGVEGVMAVGAVVAFIVTMTTGQPWLGVLAAVAAGMAISVIHARGLGVAAGQPGGVGPCPDHAGIRAVRYDGQALCGQTFGH